MAAPGNPLKRFLSNPLLRLLAGVALCLVLAGAGIWLWQQAYTDRVVRRWESAFLTKQELLTRYPKRDANARALELEALVATIGIDITPRYVGAGAEAPGGRIP